MGSLQDGAFHLDIAGLTALCGEFEAIPPHGDPKAAYGSFPKLGVPFKEGYRVYIGVIGLYRV